MRRGVATHDARGPRVRKHRSIRTNFLTHAAVLACLAAVSVARTDVTAEFQATGQVIDVPAGGSIQQALNAIQPGGTITLAPGATYVANLTLPAKGGSSYILITTRGVTLPAAGTRIDPSYQPRLATIRSPSTSSALTTAIGASYYRIVGVAFQANTNGSGDIIALGRDAQTTLDQVPHHIELDRVLISGDPTVGQKRAVSVNAAHVTITNSDIRDIKAVGQDSQAIAGWNTPGPIVIRNNYLEAAGENIMFGGANVNLPGVVPSDIVIESNVMIKNPAWRGMSWTVKNLFELKSARRVIVRRNFLQYTWAGAQPGFAVVFTPRNSSGHNPWAVVEDVEFSGNTVSHAGGGFNLLGHDDTATSGQLARILIKNNLVFSIDSEDWGGAGLFAQIGGEPRDLTFDHNTILHNGNIITFYSGSYPNASGVRVTGGPIAGFVFTNNLVKHNQYGIFGSGQAYGNGALAFYAPGAVFQRNALATDRAIASRYPPDNQFPSLAAFDAAFADAGGFDYRLAAGAYAAAGLDGRDLGCDFATLLGMSRPAPPTGARITRIQ
jgi:hypothetical protein